MNTHEKLSTYDDSDLKNDNWIRKRDKILAHADHRCQVCGTEDVPLQVHHSYYREGLRAWEYPDGSLIAVCDGCHAKVHGYEQASPPPETVVHYLDDFIKSKAQSFFTSIQTLKIGSSCFEPRPHFDFDHYGIEVLTLSENARKEFRRLKQDFKTGVEILHGRLLAEIRKPKGAEEIKRESDAMDKIPELRTKLFCPKKGRRWTKLILSGL